MEDPQTPRLSYQDLDSICDRVLAASDEQGLNSFAHFALACTEELGEFAQAVKRYGLMANQSKKQSSRTAVIEEAADAIAMILTLAKVSNIGSQEIFSTLQHKYVQKLASWETSSKPPNPLEPHQPNDKNSG